MLNKFLQYIAKEKLFTAKHKLLVAVSGGNDSIPTRIARYVDPHTTYTSPNAMMTSVEALLSAGAPTGDECAGSRSSMVVDICPTAQSTNLSD